MPTANFSDKLKKAMENDVDLLLGRLLGAYECPLTGNEIVETWNGTFAPHIQDAYYTLRSAGLYISSLLSGYQDMMVTPVQGATVMFRVRGAQCLSPPAGEINIGTVWRNRRVYSPAIEKLQAACPVDKWEGFLDWLFNRAKLEHEFEEAHETIETIINMASTVGQLRRMMPDLSTYLSDHHKNLLRSQQRSSSLPHEFAAYDHDRLHRAVAVMAKCYLLKDHDCKWSKRDEFTGANFAAD